MSQTFYTQIIIDCNNISTMKQFYDLLEVELALPEYFGRNLDALSDVLSEIDRPITFQNRGGLLIHHQEKKAYIKQIFDQSGLSVVYN